LVPLTVNLNPLATLPIRYPFLRHSLQRLLTTAESGQYGYFARENRLGNKVKQAEIISSLVIAIPWMFKKCIEYTNRSFRAIFVYTSGSNCGGLVRFNMLLSRSTDGSYKNAALSGSWFRIRFPSFVLDCGDILIPIFNCPIYYIICKT